MPIDLLEIYKDTGATKKASPVSKMETVTPSGDTIDLLDMYKVPTAAPERTTLQSIGKFGNDLIAGAVKPIGNAYLGAWQLGGNAAEGLGAINPQTNANLQGALQQMQDNVNRNHPSGTVADTMGQMGGYMGLGGLGNSAVQSALGGMGKGASMVPGMSGLGGLATGAAESMAAPTLGGALTRIGASGATMGGLGAASYVDPSSGFTRGQNAALGALGGMAGQTIGEGIGLGLSSLFKTPEAKQIVTLGSSTKRLAGQTDEILNKISVARDKYETGELAQNTLVNYSGQLRNNYQNLYDNAANSIGKNLPIANRDLASNYISIKDAFQDKIPTPIISKLESYKLFNPQGTKDLTVGDMMNLTKTINTRWATSNDPAERLALGRLNGAIYSTMDSLKDQSKSAATFLVARDSRVSYDKMFNQDDILSKIIESKGKGNLELNPEEVLKRTVSGSHPIKNLELIKKALMDDGSESAVDAWNSIRRTGLEDRLITPSIKPGTGWDSKAFIRNYDKLGERLIRTLADDPEIAGQFKLLKAASEYNLTSANLISTKIKNLLQKHYANTLTGLATGAGAYFGSKKATDVMKSLHLSNDEEPTNSSGGQQ